MEKIEVFSPELDRFKIEEVRKSAETMLELLPDHFFEVPASSSGKYHPVYALGPGGLVRHVKVALMILEDLFISESYGTYNEKDEDLIRMALMLHDGLKFGYVQKKYTLPEHPILMHDFVKKNKSQLIISSDEADFVAGLILTHMGKFNLDKNKKPIMPIPKTQPEKLVAECDYISSRPYLNVNFDGNLIVDGVGREKFLRPKK